MEAAEAANTRADMPKIQRFTVFDGQMPTPNITSISYLALVERDLIRRKSHYKPLVPPSSNSGGRMDAWLMRHVTQNCVEMEAMGVELEILDEYTGPAWLETVNGARFPAHIKETRKLVKEEYVWKVSHLVKGENISNGIRTKHDSHITDRFRWEKKAGRRLLRARMCEGIMGYEPVCLEVGEQEMDEIWADDDEQAGNDDDSQTEIVDNSAGEGCVALGLWRGKIPLEAKSPISRNGIAHTISNMDMIGSSELF